jgi:hypothetical protein
MVPRRLEQIERFQRFNRAFVERMVVAVRCRYGALVFRLLCSSNVLNGKQIDAPSAIG